MSLTKRCHRQHPRQRQFPLRIFVAHQERPTILTDFLLQHQFPVLLKLLQRRHRQLPPMPGHQEKERDIRQQWSPRYCGLQGLGRFVRTSLLVVRKFGWRSAQRSTPAGMRRCETSMSFATRWLTLCPCQSNHPRYSHSRPNAGNGGRHGGLFCTNHQCRCHRR